MPALLRRRYPERPDYWHVYYGDVHIGTIARRVGVPVDIDQWGWILGFYPGTEADEYRDGTAVTFDEVRADFEASWKALLPTRTEAHGAMLGTGLSGSTRCGTAGGALRTLILSIKHVFLCSGRRSSGRRSEFAAKPSGGH